MIVRDQHPLVHNRDCGLMTRTRACLAWFLLVVLMTPPIAPSLAAEQGQLALNGPAEASVLGQYFEYTTDPDWQLTIADFVAPSHVSMKPLPGGVSDFGYTPDRIWLRLDVTNSAQDVRDWRFYAHINFMQQIAIYKISRDGSIVTLLDLTEDSPFSARPIQYPQMVAPFELDVGDAATIIVAYYSQGSSRLSMSIETQDSFDEQSRPAQAKSYAFYGMMLVMIALAFVALLALRQPVFAAYAGYLAAVLIYIAHADGAAFQYLWPNFPRFNSMASVVAGTSVMVFAGLFAITFLQTARHHPVMHRILQAVILAVLAVDVVLWIADPQLLKRLLVQMITICVLTYLAAGLVAARTRFREVRFYVFAWCAGLIPAIMFTSRFAFGLETTWITTYDAVRLALTFDALMMGLAIFDRYNHLRQSAMEETLAHQQRNLALSQRLASLEASYQQVTERAHQHAESVKDTVHDLRQPMHALRLSLRQMFSAQSGRATDAGQVEAALAYMERLVAERLADERGAEKPRLVASDEGALPDGSAATSGTSSEPGIHDVLRGIVDMFAPEAEAKDLRLRLVLAAPDGAASAYPLMRVVANLVSNAIKYTRKGRIVVALRRSGGSYRVEVHDTGPGLSGAAFGQALLRNERLERDLSAAEGSGLGLSVVNQIANANNWKVSACDGRRTGATIRVDMSVFEKRADRVDNVSASALQPS